MPSFGSSRRRVLYAFCALLFILSLFTAFGERGVLRLWRLRGEKMMLEEKNFLLQKENETLRERIYRIRHDDRYLEKIAREELGRVRPGEIIYRFPSPESKRNKSGAISEPPAGLPRSWEQKPPP